jgi:hypothetical protein
MSQLMEANSLLTNEELSDEDACTYIVIVRMAYRTVTSRLRMSSGSWRREGPYITVHYVTSLPPASPLLMSAIHSDDTSEVYKLSRSKHTYMKACREVNMPCSQFDTTARSCCSFVTLHSPSLKQSDSSPRASVVPRAFYSPLKNDAISQAQRFS